MYPQRHIFAQERLLVLTASIANQKSKECAAAGLTVVRAFNVLDSSPEYEYCNNVLYHCMYSAIIEHCIRKYERRVRRHREVFVDADSTRRRSAAACRCILVTY